MIVRNLGRIFLACAPALALGLAACSGPSYPQVSDKITAGIFLDPESSEGRSGTPIRAVTEAGLKLLKEYEGEVRCKPETTASTHCPYDDSSKYCTIGHGHLIDKASCESLKAKLEELGFQDGISQAEADDLLRDDLAMSQLGLEKQIDPAGKVGLAELSDSQYNALTSLIFNIGVANFRTSTLLKKLQARADISGDLEVANQILRWNKSKGKYVPGLYKRREKEVAHFFTGYELPVTGRSGEEDDGIDIDVGKGEK